MESGNIIELKDVRVKKGLNTVLRDVNLKMKKGECVAVVGTAGSGKTTLGQVASGLIKPNEGQVKMTPGMSAYFVAQQDDFFNKTKLNLTYYSQRYEYSDANDAIPLVGGWLNEMADSMDGADRKEDVFRMMNIEPLLSRNLMQLSNGERKRTQIALSLLSNAHLYVLDQPFLGLDTATRVVLRDTLRTLKEKGISLLIICGAREVPDFADRVLSLDAGVFTEEMPTAAYIERERSKKEEDFHLDETELPLLYEHPEYGFVVRMRNVHVTMGGETLLSDINWEVKDHERWLLSGHNGSGKSTLLSLITADNPQAYANDIALFGKQRGSGESIWEIKKKIGFVSPELHLYVLRQTKLVNSSRSSMFDLPCMHALVSGFNDQIGFSSEPTNYEVNVAQAWLSALHLDYLANKNFCEISLGEQRMVLLIRALLKNPPLLILDEPCQGIDYEQSRRIVNMLDAICSKLNNTLIYVSHSPDEIPTCITHRLELKNGRQVS